jgi:hypothetical protein
VESTCSSFTNLKDEHGALRDYSSSVSHVQWDLGILKVSIQIWESKHFKRRTLPCHLDVTFTCPFLSIPVRALHFPGGREKHVAFFGY